MNPIRKNKIKKLAFDIWKSFTFMCQLTLTLFFVISCLSFWAFMVFYISSLGIDITEISKQVISMSRVIIFVLTIVLIDRVINKFISMRY